MPLDLSLDQELALLLKSLPEREPTPRERAAADVVDRFLVLRDEMKHDHTSWNPVEYATQRLYLRFPEEPTCAHEIAEGASLVARRELYRMMLIRMVLEAIPEVAHLPEENPPAAPGSAWERLRMNLIDDED